MPRVYISSTQLLRAAVLLLLSPARGVTMKKLFRKVALETLYKACLLQSLSSTSDTEKLTLGKCASLCTQHSSCRTFCYSADLGRCATSTAFTAHWFPGQPETDDDFSYDACYSSWASYENIIRDTMATTSSTPSSNKTTGNFGIDGYFCQTDDEQKARYFHTYGDDESLFTIDLGREVSVRELRVAYFPSQDSFNLVVFTLRDAGTTQSELIAFLETSDRNGDSRVIVNSPITGRILEIRSPKELILGEVQVISEG